MKKLLLSAAALGLAFGMSSTAMATNGMNLEGFGPVALGMGGSSFAYDNGTAATMNNPATIGASVWRRAGIIADCLAADCQHRDVYVAAFLRSNVSFVV